MCGIVNMLAIQKNNDNLNMMAYQSYFRLTRGVSLGGSFPVFLPSVDNI